MTRTSVKKVLYYPDQRVIMGFQIILQQLLLETVVIKIARHIVQRRQP